MGLILMRDAGASSNLVGIICFLVGIGLTISSLLCGIVFFTSYLTRAKIKKFCQKLSSWNNEITHLYQFLRALVGLEIAFSTSLKWLLCSLFGTDLVLTCPVICTYGPNLVKFAIKT